MGWLLYFGVFFVTSLQVRYPAGEDLMSWYHGQANGLQLRVWLKSEIRAGVLRLGLEVASSMQAEKDADRKSVAQPAI